MFPRRARLVVLAALVFVLSVGCAYVRGTLLKPQPESSLYSVDADAAADSGVTPSALASEVVSVVAKPQGQTQALPADLTCFNVNSVQIPSWHSSQLISATKKLTPSVLRIPGGEVANYWDWQRGGIVEDGEPMLEALPDGLPEYMRYEARSHTGSKLEDYAAGLSATNARALFVLNMLTSDLAEQIDMLSAAARAGIEIKYIELGNEYYFGIPNYAHKFPTPESYGEEAKVWIRYLRDIFPDIEIAVFGVVPSGDSSNRESRWNQALMDTALPVADAIALHLYPGHGLDPNGFSDSGYPAFDERDFGTIFSEPFRYWQALRDRPAYRLIPQDKEIWITEFNLIEDVFGGNSSRLPRVMGTWGHGLYALAMNLMFLEEPRVTMTCNHDLVENYRFGAILPHENSFEVSAKQAYPVDPMSLSATGQSLRMLAESVRKMSDRQPLTFSDQPDLTTQDGKPSVALYGWVFSDSADSNSASAPNTAPANTSLKQATAVVLNLSDRIVQLDVSDVVGPNQSVTYQQLSADPRTLVTNEQALTLKKGGEKGRVTEAVTLSPHSVTQLSSWR